MGSGGREEGEEMKKRKVQMADIFDVWGKPPPLLRTITKRQEQALKRYIDKVASKVYRLAYDCGAASERKG